MSKIRIIFSGVTSANENLHKIIRELSDIERSLSSLCSSIDPGIQSRHNIAARLKDCRICAEEGMLGAKRLYRATADGIDKYRVTEALIQRVVPDEE